MGGPTGDRLIRVDMTNQTATTEPYPDEWKLLGGRALSARILLRRVRPDLRRRSGRTTSSCWRPACLAGTRRPDFWAASRSAGKSPLTGGIKEANAGGEPGPGPHEARLSRRRREGPARRPRASATRSTSPPTGRRSHPGDRVQGQVELRADRGSRRDYSKTASFISIGPAGELKALGCLGGLHRPGAGSPPRPPRRRAAGSAP